jgi:hypothetical protein
VSAGAVANFCFGHVLIAVRRSRLRRDAAGAGEEQLGGCIARRLYYTRQLTFDELVSLADSYAAGV